MPTKPSKDLETFANPHPERDYEIRITVPEFTCLCPKTGQPDFAVLYLEYIPDQKCVELKSLKQYVWSYRNEGAFHEAVTNKILNDLVAATEPRYMQLRAEFNVRGGIYTAVVAEHRKPGWGARREIDSPAPGVDRPAEAPSTVAAGATAPAAARPSRFRMLPRNRTPQAEPEPEPEPAAKAPPSVAAAAAVAKPAPPPVAPPKPAPTDSIYIGLDIGTSAVRAVAIDGKGKGLADAAAPLPLPQVQGAQAVQDPLLWWNAVVAVLEHLLAKVDRARVRALAIDGTSATVVLTDNKGTPLAPAAMYHDRRAAKHAERIAALAPRSPAASATSGLAKLLWWQSEGLTKKAAHALSQSDWLAGKFTGRFGVSDYNNALKFGYDCEAFAWPAFIGELGFEARLLPTVVAPGEAIGKLGAPLAKKLGLSTEVVVVAGTTDGVAAFVAAGATRPGEAVSSLGSTLVLKLLSDKPVTSPEHGVYSHRLGDTWLIGGASNAGGATLLQYFNPQQMEEMTPLLQPDQPTGLGYYPLPAEGERFPVNNPHLKPVLEPLPGDSVVFFQGMLEGIADIEAQGYRLLHSLGAPAVRVVFTTGGGAHNTAWTRIRARLLGTEMKPARSTQAAYGVATIAAGLHRANAKENRLATP